MHDADVWHIVSAGITGKGDKVKPHLHSSQFTSQCAS